MSRESIVNEAEGKVIDKVQSSKVGHAIASGAEKAKQGAKSVSAKIKGAAKAAAGSVGGAIGGFVQKNIPPEMVIVPSKIIAKLHLAGKEQVTKNKVINTGIIKDNDNGPDKPGDIDFDLNSKDGTYELGIIIPIEYKIDKQGILDAVDQKVRKDIGIDKDLENVKKMNDKLNLKDGDAEKIKELETKLSGEGIADDEVKKINDELAKIKPKGYEDILKAKEAYWKQAKDKIDKYYKETLGKDPKDLGDEKTSPDEVYGKVIKAAQEKNGATDLASQIKEIRQVEIDKAADEALKDIEAYMKLFAGDKYGKPTKPASKDLVYMNVPENFSSMSGDLKKYVVDYKIKGMSEEEVKKDKEQQEKRDPNKINETMCFKVKFSIKASEK